MHHTHPSSAIATQYKQGHLHLNEKRHRLDWAHLEPNGNGLRNPPTHHDQIILTLSALFEKHL